MSRLFTRALYREGKTVTMMITSTADRLHMLDDLCRSWPFVISAAMYVAAVDGNATAAAAAILEASLAAQAAYTRQVALHRLISASWRRSHLLHFVLKLCQTCWELPTA